MSDDIGRYYERCRERAESAAAALDEARRRNADPREIRRLERELERARDTGD